VSSTSLGAVRDLERSLGGKQTDRKTGAAAVIGSSIAIFWQGHSFWASGGVALLARSFVGRGPSTSSFLHSHRSSCLCGWLAGEIRDETDDLIGTVICGLNLFLAYASNVFLLYLWAFLMGLASCFVYIPALTSVQRGILPGASCDRDCKPDVWPFRCCYVSDVRLDVCLGLCAMSTLAVIALLAGLAAQFTEAPRQGAGEATSELPRSRRLGHL
jgi:hypothetical protein